MAGPAAGAAARRFRPTINDLGDDLILSVMRNIGLQARHATLALVCRRWAQLVVSPPLLHTISLNPRKFFDSTDEQQRALSFCAWLQRRAVGSVRQLHVSMSAPSNGWGEEELCNPYLVGDVDEEAQREMREAVLAAAAACCRLDCSGSSTDAGTSSGSGSGSSSAGGLQELILKLEDFQPWRLTPQVVSSLAGLRVLDIRLASEEGPLGVSCPLLPLAGLQELRLEAWDSVELSSDATLPPSLTKLHLKCSGSVPKQVLTLPALKHLALVSADGSYDPYSQAYSSLGRLGGSLELLDLRFCFSLPSPATLAALPRLRALHIKSAEVGGEIGPALTAALQALAGQLEEFSLEFVDWVGMEDMDMEGLPAAVAGLRRLQRLRIDGLPRDWRVRGWEGVYVQLLLPAEAPVWGSLQRLALSADVAAANTAALTAAAKQLEWLGVFDVGSHTPAHHELLSEAARQLPRLRHLCIGQQAGPFAEVAAAAEQRNVKFFTFEPLPSSSTYPDRTVNGFWEAAFAE